MNAAPDIVNDPIVDSFAHFFNIAGTGSILWLLVSLSVISVSIMIERYIFFKRNSFGRVDTLIEKLEVGDFNSAIRMIGDKRGLEAEVLRRSAIAVDRGADAVQEIVKATIIHERLRYEKYLSYLGTLGNNAPFIGLFGTVLGIIKAFAALATNTQTTAIAAGSANIMAGISEALVATAVGLLVAIPAVAVYNVYGRWLKTIVSRSEAIGHALSSHLKTTT